jgi:hypothetical protein
MNHCLINCLIPANYVYPDVTSPPLVNGTFLPVSNSHCFGPDVWVKKNGGSEPEMAFVRKILGSGNQESKLIDMDLTSLDVAMKDFSGSGVDFIKIGAEGRDENILHSGVSFFTGNSPLVMFEILPGNIFHPELVCAFKSLDYDSYRFIPGLECLAPIPTVNDPDPYCANAFCCKPDRADILEKNGFLTHQGTETDTDGNTNPTLWIDYVGRFPYAIRLLRLWKQFLLENEGDSCRRLYLEALSSYAVSRMTRIPQADRFQTLNRAYLLLREVVRRNPTFSRLMSLFRVVADLGYRKQTDIVLRHLIRMMEIGDPISIAEPFLAVSSRFEQIDPDQEIGNWCLVSLLETYEQNQPLPAHAGADISSGNLELLKTLPFYNPKMEQRRKLIQERFDRQD